MPDNNPKKVVLVAVAVDSPRLPGLIAYAREKGNWRLVGNTENCRAGIAALQKTNQRCDGILAFVINRADAQVVKELKIPAVNLSGSLDNLGFPRVCPDDYAIGKLAADYLLNKSYQRLAICWCDDLVYANRRKQGFVDRVEQAGKAFTLLPTINDLMVGTPEYRDIIKKKKKIKAPVGIFVDTDRRARQLIQACNDAGLRIPEDVSIIGVDNLETVCELCDPSLTSISRQDYQAGYQAAALLDKIMSGQYVDSKTEVLLPPVGVVERGSTDMLGIDSRKIALAAKYIKKNIHKRFKIEDIVNDLDVSRRWLQRGFNQWLKMTPLQYINELRIERVKKLIASPEKHKLKDITQMCGFRDQTRLGLVFKRVTGMSIKEYKKSLAEKKEAENRD